MHSERRKAMKLLAPFFSALLLAGVTLQAQEAPPQQPQGEQAAQEQAATEEQDAQKERIRSAQQILQEKGLYSGSIDGIAGPQTAAALREFQQSQQLEPTGKLDDETAKRLGIE
jgi:peptidoglycan hydrolase-like protein with peptidoglycan-binding domain